MGNKWTVAAISGFLGGSAALGLFLAGLWWGGATKKSSAEKFFDKLAGEDDRPKTPDLPPPLLATTARPAEHAKLQGKWKSDSQSLEFAGDTLAQATADGRRASRWTFVLRGQQIDLWSRRSTHAAWEKVREGVFRFDGDALVIACGDERPQTPDAAGWGVWPNGRFRRNE